MRLQLAFVFLVSLSGAIAAETDRPQDQFDESVGYAYGYTLMASRMGEKCIELYPETATSIREGLREWQLQNAQALAEVRLQWDAYVERDAAATHLSQSSYSAALEREVPGAVARTFGMLGGFQSSGAKRRCESYAFMLLDDPPFQLEKKLLVELEAFRACKSRGRCPNVRRTP